MPRYFIDYHDARTAHLDDEGSLLPGLAEARAEAMGVLQDVVRPTMTDGERHVFQTSVRNEAGATIYRATLTFVGEQVTVPAPLLPAV